MRMRITLPWPSKVLSPNARVHWRTKANAAATFRELAYYTASMAPADQRMHLREAKALKLTLTFLPPDKRRRDLDNLGASLKAALDGICHACKIDDSLIRETTHAWGPVIDGGAVNVELA